MDFRGSFKMKTHVFIPLSGINDIKYDNHKGIWKKCPEKNNNEKTACVARQGIIKSTFSPISNTKRGMRY